MFLKIKSPLKQITQSVNNLGNTGTTAITHPMPKSSHLTDANNNECVGVLESSQDSTSLHLPDSSGTTLKDNVSSIHHSLVDLSDDAEEILDDPSEAAEEILDEMDETSAEQTFDTGDESLTIVDYQELDDELFRSSRFLIVIEHDSNRLKNKDFAHVMKFTETFRILSYLYDLDLAIDVELFIKSVLTNDKLKSSDEHAAYFERVIQSLVRIFLVNENYFEACSLLLANFEEIYSENCDLVQLCLVILNQMSDKSKVNLKVDKCDLLRDRKSGAASSLVLVGHKHG